MSDRGGDHETSRESDEREHGCAHYVRRCSIECPNCLEFFPCRLCHDEKSEHQLDRFSVKNVKCTICGAVQEVSERCKHCKTSFGKYCCLTCHMFDDCDKKQFHCDGCGICRVGGRENFFHCENCGLCLSINIKDTHGCVEKSSKSNCPVCLEDLHSSVRVLEVPSCGHLIHRSCYRAMIKHGDYRCATCGKSTVNMASVWQKIDSDIESTPMPEEYADTLMWVLCKDCQEVSEVKFHVLGMKCDSCGSYNTCNTAAPTITRTEDDDE